MGTINDAAEWLKKKIEAMENEPEPEPALQGSPAGELNPHWIWWYMKRHDVSYAEAKKIGKARLSHTTLKPKGGDRP